MEFRILGPIEVRDGDRVLPLGAGQQRALLASLLLRANETIARDRLIHDLWGERAPATAAKALQGHVSMLRRLLEPERERGADGRIVLTRTTGYELRIDREQLDLGRHERLRDEGRRALADGRPEQAAARLREALDLWRGPPLADVAYQPFAQSEIARLEELRVATIEDRLDADLASGRDADLVGELEALIAEHPLRERLRAQLMLALYRAGRQAEALGAYQDSRRVLVGELGIEPGRELQELERAILRHDTALDRRAPQPAELARAEETQAAGRLVGRERELAILTRALDQAFAGRGRLVLVGGEPGIGKSRLAEELARHAQQRGAVTLFGRAWEAGGAPAYWPWVQAIRAYIRDRDRGTVREQLGDGAADVAQMLPELRELLPDVGPPVSQDPEGARFRLFDATTVFLRNVGKNEPLVLVLDDLHAVDTSSLLLLEFTASQLAEMRVLVLGLYRDVEIGSDHPLAAALAELTRYEPLALRLAGLGEDDIARLIETRHGVEPVHGLATAIHEGTEGNPLFVGEILRLLAEEGRLSQTVAGSGRPFAIPVSVREVIRRRLRHLSNECVDLLTRAAVLGREFSVDALALVSEQELEQILDLLEEAIASGVVGEGPGARGRLRFAHVLIRDTLYDELPMTRRVRLHRSLAEALEQLYAHDLDPHLAELAHHLSQADPVADARTAADYARRAGDRAARLLAYEEAARLYRMALAALESGRVEDADRCELLLRLGDVQARAGDVSVAKETLLRAAEIARAAGLATHFARAALGYGGRFVWARAWGDTNLVQLLEEALTLLPDGDSELRVRLLSRLAAGPLRDLVLRGRRVAMAQEAVEMARRLGDPSTLAYALEARFEANWAPDVLDERLAIANELIEVAEKAADAERIFAGLDSRFDALLESGDVRAAYRDHEAATKLATDLRQPAQLWDCVAIKAMLALCEGRFAEAEPDIHEALELGHLAQSPNAQDAFDLQIYALRREQGRILEVVEVVEQAAARHDTYPIWPYVRADVLAQVGRTADARAALDALAAEGFRVHLDELWLFSLSLLSEVCRFLDDAARAATLFDLLRPYAGRNTVAVPQICSGSLSRGLGILAATISRWDDAFSLFEHALEMNAEMGARPWLAYTQYDYGLMLLARGARGDRERARELMGSAGALANDLGMIALAERISAKSSA